MTDREKSISAILESKVLRFSMKVLELVGSRVWIRCGQFRTISGVISDVLTPVSHEDLHSSIAQSLFNIALPSGEVVQMLGTEMCKVDHVSTQGISR
jgi:hypothetical protein